MSGELLMGPDDFEAESDSRIALPASNKVEESMTERKGSIGQDKSGSRKCFHRGG